MNKFLPIILLALIQNITAYAKTDGSTNYHRKQIAVMRKLTHDTRAIQEYATLGRAQCYSMLFGLEEKYNEVKNIEESNLFFNAHADIGVTQSPLFSLTTSESIKNNVVNYIKTWQKRPSYSPAYQKDYSINYQETEKCEKMFDANNSKLRQSYLKFVRNTDNYEKPENPTCEIDCYGQSQEEIEQKYDNYLKYYIEYVEPDGCPLGKQENC